jgi:phosphoglycerol transferase MdoB-like AlkP superfamily enzyme
VVVTTIFANLKFILGLMLVLVLTFSGLRFLLLWQNRELTAKIPAKVLARSFFVGWRFDMIIIGAIMLLPIVVQFFPLSPISRSLPLYWCGIAGTMVVFFAVLELEFYQQFHTRLNSLVFEYLKEDRKTISSMIWNGCPVLHYFSIWIGISILMICGFLWVNNQTLIVISSGIPQTSWFVRLLIFLPLLVVTAIGCRGTLRKGPPLRWGDAFHSTYLFANHLALNGFFTLIKAIIDVKRNRTRKRWLRFMPENEALAKTRELLLQKNTELTATPDQPIKRRHPANSVSPGIKNVVVILMESFSAQFIGALGKPGNITPEFNRLAQRGVLFDHFFSNGTHTHQGAFATLASFPNIPGFEYLMQQPQGATGFSGLASLLKKSGYQDLYVYNGDFAWDNQEGFFRNQGMTNFIGRFDYDNPEFVDPTWGVSDNDMFNRAHLELEKISGDKPFFAILQTLSNHLPFTIPEPLPIAKVSGHGTLDGHLTALCYADWALGQFFAKAEQSPYYNDTLFVLLGDHGFCLPQQLTDIDLSRFHIPLLLLGPGLQDKFGARRTTVATQVDVVPTIMGLLGKSFTHQCWGRDLFNLAPDDPGFGIIKPSGSDATAALLQGQQSLVHPPDGDNIKLYNYTLYPDATVQQLDDLSRQAEMTAWLGAYIQTAMGALLSEKLGI